MNKKCQVNFCEYAALNIIYSVATRLLGTYGWEPYRLGTLHERKRLHGV